MEVTTTFYRGLNSSEEIDCQGKKCSTIQTIAEDIAKDLDL